MRAAFLILLLGLLVPLGCRSNLTGPLTTGIQGTILKGPTQPVCTETSGCTAPLVASFGVWSDGDKIDAFRTDSTGYFRVLLEPGIYQIIPGPDAGTFIAHQYKTVMVTSSGITNVRLEFDTGIR